MGIALFIFHPAEVSPKRRGCRNIKLLQILLFVYIQGLTIISLNFTYEKDLLFSGANL